MDLDVLPFDDLFRRERLVFSVAQISSNFRQTYPKDQECWSVATHAVPVCDKWSSSVIIQKYALRVITNEPLVLLTPCSVVRFGKIHVAVAVSIRNRIKRLNYAIVWSYYSFEGSYTIPWLVRNHPVFVCPNVNFNMTPLSLIKLPTTNTLTA